jgi:hypothetical protein
MPLIGFLGFLVPLGFLALLVLVIAAMVGGRGEPDPTGRRLYAIYLAIVTFITLFTTLGTTFLLLQSLFETLLVGSSADCPSGVVNETCVMLGSGSGGREVLQAALVVAATGVVLYLHGRKLLELAGERPAADSPTGRVILTFGYATAFGLVFAILGGTAAALSALVDLPAGGSGFRSTDQTLATLLSSALFAGGSAWLFFYVWRTLGLGITTRVTPTPPTPPSAPPPGL